MWWGCLFQGTTKVAHIYKDPSRFAVVSEWWEGEPISLFDIEFCTDFIQDRSFHLQKSPTRRPHVRGYEVDNHPLLIPPLCCLSVPLFDLLADGRFVRFNVLGDGIQRLSIVFKA